MQTATTSNTIHPVSALDHGLVCHLSVRVWFLAASWTQFKLQPKKTTKTDKDPGKIWLVWSRWALWKNNCTVSLLSALLCLTLFYTSCIWSVHFGPDQVHVVWTFLDQTTSEAEPNEGLLQLQLFISKLIWFYISSTKIGFTYFRSVFYSPTFQFRLFVSCLWKAAWETDLFYSCLFCSFK